MKGGNKMNNKNLMIVLVVIALAVGAYFVMQSNSDDVDLSPDNAVDGGVPHGFQCGCILTADERRVAEEWASDSNDCEGTLRFVTESDCVETWTQDAGYACNGSCVHKWSCDEGPFSVWTSYIRTIGTCAYNAGPTVASR